MMVSSRAPGLGLDYRPNPRWTGQAPLLRRVAVRFTVSLEMMVALLRRDRLDAAALPSSVNLDERLDEIGIDHAQRPRAAAIYLDLEGTSPDRSVRERLVAQIDRGAIAEGLIRDDGEVADAPSVDAEPGGSAMAIQLAAPAGDELLTLMQRIIQRQMKDAGITVELVTIEPSTFYGSWARDDHADLALRRAPSAPNTRALDAYPLFEVDSLIAWDGEVVGMAPHGGTDGPFWNIETWGRGSSD